MRLLPAHRHRSAIGQSMVEFALLLPLMAFLMVIAIDFGRAYYSYIQITNAAREGAAAGAITPTDVAAIQAQALAETNVQGQAGESAVSVTTECRDTTGSTMNCALAPGGAGAGNTLTVTVAEDFSFLTPLVNSFFNDSFTMRTSATVAVLGYAGSSSSIPPGSCSGPTASFSVIVTSGLSIEVDPAASSPNSPGNPCNISGYIWEWGDGEDAIGNASAAQHTYSAAGTYTIQLEVTNQGGSSITTQLVTVPLTTTPSCDPPDASFTYTETTPAKNTYVHRYTDTSKVKDPVNCPITQWEWTFPNGTHTNAPAPADQTYDNNGKHTVTLKVTNAGGSDTFSWKH